MLLSLLKYACIPIDCISVSLRFSWFVVTALVRRDLTRGERVTLGGQSDCCILVYLEFLVLTQDTLAVCWRLFPLAASVVYPAHRTAESGFFSQSHLVSALILFGPICLVCAVLSLLILVVSFCL